MSLFATCAGYGVQKGLALWVGAAGLGGLIAAVITSRGVTQRRGLLTVTVLIGILGSSRSLMRLLWG